MKGYKQNLPTHSDVVRRLANCRNPKRGRGSRLLGAFIPGVMMLALVFPPQLMEWRTSAQLVSCSITQITSTTGGQNGSSSINADGTRIAFTSNRDLTGGNADGNQELFLYDTQTGITQVTNTTGGVNSLPSINADGTRIAIQSNRDLLMDGSNADLNFEIFL